MNDNRVFELKREIYEVKFNPKSAFIPEYLSVPQQTDASGVYKFVKADAEYTVKVEENTCRCDCKGFTYNGYCKHATHIRLLRGDIHSGQQAASKADPAAPFKS